MATNTAPLVSTGDVDQDSAVLWARVFATGTASFVLREGSTVVFSDTANATSDLLPLKIDLVDGTLEAGTAYSWTVTDSAGASTTASFRTPDAAGIRNGFSMGVTGDWRGELAPYPAISNAALANLDLFIKLGDTIYADYASPATNNAVANTLQEYRQKHAEVYGERAGLNTFADLQKTTPILSAIDDHEVWNDFSGGDSVPAADTAFWGSPAGTRINDTLRYDNGLQAFEEWNAIETRRYGATGDARTAGEIDLYRYSIDGEAANFVLDARSFRDAPITAWNGTGPDAIRFLTEAANPSRTMLGAAQFDRLRADLLDADAKGVAWKFISVPEPIQNYGPLNAQDRFEGYAAERAALLGFIDAMDIEGVVFIAADVHGTTVNNLTYQLSAGGPQIALASFEITTGSVAFDPPFAPAALEFAATAGLLSPQQVAFYNSLPVANDADSAPNDKDDFFKAIVNQQTTPFGYDPMGLNANLAQANGLLNTTLTQGDYVAVHTYGWSEFDVDAATGALTVTTWGIAAYTDGEATLPGTIARTPSIVSRFTVAETSAIEFTLFDDALGGNAMDDLTYTNAAAAGVQTGSALTDSTGSDLARFRQASGDTSLVSALFDGTAVLGKPVVLDWRDAGDAVLVNRKPAAIGAIDVTDFVGASLVLRGFEEVRIEGDGGRGQTFVLRDAMRTEVDLGAGADVVMGSTGADSITAGGGTDRLVGGAGNDWLAGEAGDDRLLGGAGADTLLGGEGRDLLRGDAGNDRFVWQSLTDSVAGKLDVVQDFVRGQDRLDVSAIDANAVQAGDQAFAFIGSAAFTGGLGLAELRIMTLGSRVLVLLDSADADAVADSTFVVLGQTRLNQADFAL
jgi:phosphodiesterase/alkaline phosphatase D-like protein